MFQITATYGTASCQLLFKSEDAASEAWQTLIKAESEITISDEFGRTIHLIDGALTGVLFENLDLTKIGIVETALHQARVQAEANKRGMSDPVLSNAQRLMSGPAMLSPMGPLGNGRFS